MKKKFTFLITAALMLLTMMATTGTMWGQSRTTKTYKLTISPDDFNTTSYAANNNEKTSNAVNTSDITDTYQVKWTSNQVMKSGNNMQWQKNKGYIYNSTNLGTITSVIVTSSAGSFTTYYGTSEQPSSGTSGDGKGYFKTSVGNATGTTSKVEVTFTITTYTVTYDGNDATSGTAPTDSNSPYLSGSDVTVLGNTGSLVKDGHNFSGWCLNAAGTGTVYGPGDGQTHTLESLSDNTVFYAKWTAAGDYITVAPTTANVACSGDDVEFSIDTDQTLDVNPVVFYTTSSGDVTTTKPSWIGDLSSAYNSGTGKLTVPVTANTGAARTAYFRVEHGSVKSDVVTLNQAAYSPAAPILPAAGNFDYSKEIEITVPDGTTVYYTLDGTDPTSSSSQYTEPFTINATKTVKAVAYEGTYPSAVVSATYTRTYDYISDITSANYYTVKGTVVAVNGTYGFVLGDGTGYIYCYMSHNKSVGDWVIITYGHVKNYNHVWEFENGTLSEAASSTYTTGTPAITAWTEEIFDSYSGSGVANLGTYFEVVGTYATTNKEITITGTSKKVRLSSNNTYGSLNGKTVKAKGYFAGMNTSGTTPTAMYICPESVEAIPVLTTSVSSISNFTYNYGGGPDAKYFTVTGANLTHDITVSTNSVNFEISSDNSNWQTSDITISKGNGTVSATTIYVRLKSGLDSNTYNGKIIVSSDGADDKEIALTGTVKHTITIDPSIENGAVNSDPSEAALAGATVTLTAEPAANYKLGSFTVTKAGSETVDVTPTGANTGTFTMPADNVTVSATFTQAYAVTYAANGGSGTMTDPNSPYVAGTQVTLLPNAFTYTGHTWSSWSVKDASQNTVAVSEGKFTMPSSAVTVTAQWTTNTHNITMPAANTYGEYTTVSTSAVPYGTEVELTYTPAEGYEHYVAVWSVNGTPIDGNTFNMPDEDVTVTVSTHATWTVTYDANGGSGTVTDPNSPYDNGANVTVLANGFVYINHTFVKWNTQANGEGIDYAPGATISGISADVTLYAQWESGSHVTYTVESTSTVSAAGAIPAGSSATYSSTYGTIYQLTNGNSMTLTLTGFAGQIVKKITLSMHSNGGGGSGNMNMNIGETSYASIATAAFNTSSWNSAYTTDWVNIQRNASPNDHVVEVGEDIVITIAATANSLFCKSFTIDYETSSDPMVLVSPTTQTVNHEVQGITTGDKIFNLYSLNIDSPIFVLAYCDEYGNVLDSNPYSSWFTAAVSDNEKVTYSVTANTGGDRTAYFKVYATVAGDPVYSGLCSLTQKHEPHTYSLVDGSTVTLEAGKHYIIASGTSGTIGVMGRQNSSVRDTVKVVMSSSQITEKDGFYEVVLSGSGTASEPWTMYSVKDGGYLYATGSNGANIGICTDNVTTNPTYGQWTITISSNIASITCKASLDYNKFMYNSSSPRFACYKSSQSSVYLYKRDGDKDLEFYSPTTLASATIAETETYIVESGQVLTVTGALTNQGTASNLIIEDGGQLIHNNDGVQATIIRNVNGYGRGGSGYQLIASPVTSNLDVATGTNLTTGGSYDLYIFDESKASKEWRNYKADTLFTTIDNEKGYLYANSSSIPVTFSGEIRPSNEDATINLNYHEGNRFAGWNLVGNPFPCKAYLTDTTDLGMAFYRMNDAGNGFTAVANGAIAPMEGIFVKAIDSLQSFKFTRNAPSADPSKGNLNIQVAKVNIRGTQLADDNAIIRFDGGNSLEKFSFSDNNAKVYIPQGNKDYAIASVNGDGASAFSTMPVNFRAAENGSYTIGVSMNNVEFSYLHLIDNKTGMDVDLLQTPSYSFEATTGDQANRFRLVFNTTGVSENDNEGDSFGFISDGNLMILGIEGEATLQVIDVTGRILSSETFNGSYNKAVNAAQGVYMLRLIQGENVRTQKIVIK